MNEQLTNETLSADSGQQLQPGTGSTSPKKESRAAVSLPEDALIILPVRNMVLFPGAWPNFDWPQFP